MGPQSNFFPIRAHWGRLRQSGILVFLKPKLGAYVVMAWLVAIALTLLFGGHYFDVAVRDLVMAVGAFSLRL